MTNLSNRLNRFDFIADQASDDSVCKSNRERAQFHYFNDNGLNHQHRRMSDTISQWVDEGHIPSGWILAYGSLNYYTTDRLTEVAMKRRVDPIELRIILDRLQEQVDTGYTKLGEFILSDEPSFRDSK